MSGKAIDPQVERVFEKFLQLAMELVSFASCTGFIFHTGGSKQSPNLISFKWNHEWGPRKLTNSVALRLYNSFLTRGTQDSSCGQTANGRRRHIVQLSLSEELSGYIELVQQPTRAFAEPETQILDALGRLCKHTVQNEFLFTRLCYLYTLLVERKTEISDCNNVVDVLDRYVEKVARWCHDDWPNSDGIVRISAKLVNPGRTALFVKSYLETIRLT